jgi:hypothetical protein
MRKELIKVGRVYTRKSRSNSRYARVQAQYPIIVLALGKYTMVSEPCGMIAVEAPQAVVETRVVAARPANWRGEILPDTEWKLEIFTTSQIAMTWEEYQLKHGEEEMLRLTVEASRAALGVAETERNNALSAIIEKLPESIRLKAVTRQWDRDRTAYFHQGVVKMEPDVFIWLMTHGEVKGIKTLIKKYEAAQRRYDEAVAQWERDATCAKRAGVPRYNW